MRVTDTGVFIYSMLHIWVFSQTANFHKLGCDFYHEPHFTFVY